jgi:hypothetical protein
MTDIGSAFGHPLGCTGARQVVTALSELRRQNKRIAVTSMCVGTVCLRPLEYFVSNQTFREWEWPVFLYLSINVWQFSLELLEFQRRIRQVASSRVLLFACQVMNSPRYQVACMSHMPFVRSLDWLCIIHIVYKFHCHLPKSVSGARVTKRDACMLLSVLTSIPA